MPRPLLRADSAARYSIPIAAPPGSSGSPPCFRRLLPMHDLAAWLARCPLAAILRGIRPEEAEAIGEVLVAASFAIIEVPLNSPEPLRSIGALARRFGTTTLIG